MTRDHGPCWGRRVEGRRVGECAYSGRCDQDVAGGTVGAAARRHRGARVEERGDQAHGRGDAGRRAEHDQERAGGRRRRHHGRDAGGHRVRGQPVRRRRQRRAERARVRQRAVSQHGVSKHGASQHGAAAARWSRGCPRRSPG